MVCRRDYEAQGLLAGTDLLTGKVLWTRRLPSAEIVSVCALGEASFLATSGDGMVYKISAPSGETEASRRLNDTRVDNAIAVGDGVVVCQQNRIILLRGTDLGKVWEHRAPNDDPPRSYSPEQYRFINPRAAPGKVLVSRIALYGGRGDALIELDIADGRPRTLIQLPEQAQPGFEYALCDGLVVLSAGVTLMAIEALSTKLVWREKVSGGVGNLLIVGDHVIAFNGGEIEVRNLRTGKLKLRLPGVGRPHYMLPWRDSVIAMGYDGEVCSTPVLD